MLRLIPLLFAVVIAALLFMPRGAPSGVYAMAPARALAIVDRVELPPAIFGGFKPAIRHWRPDNATLMWALLGDGDIELRRFRASFTPEGEGVRVRVEALPPRTKPRDESTPAIADEPEYGEYLSAAIAEQIDAKLTGREFDQKNIALAYRRFQIADIPRIRREIDAGDKLAQKHTSDIIEDAYAHEK